MKRSIYGRTDTTKSAIRKAERVIANAKKESPLMTWQDRNILMNIVADLYKDDEMFQPIYYCDSVCKWWNKRFGGR